MKIHCDDREAFNVEVVAGRSHLCELRCHGGVKVRLERLLDVGFVRTTSDCSSSSVPFAFPFEISVFRIVY